MITLYRRYSLYTILWLVVMTTVLLVMTGNAVLSCRFARDRIIEETRLHSGVTMLSLKKNIAKDIESYAINEYENLVFNEMNHVVFSAIIVRDYNMGAILGQEAYISGKIRDEDGGITDFDPENPDMLRRINESFLSLTDKMTSSSGHELGTISLYGSNKKMEQELDAVLKESLIKTAFLSLALTLLLFFAIQSLVLRPLALIITALTKIDENGIPCGEISPPCALEIADLAESLTNMISAVRESRQKLEDQHACLQKNEKALILAEEKQREILWATNVGTWEWNVQSDEVAVNERWAGMLGYTLEELKPCCRAAWRKFTHPEDLDRSEHLLQNHLSGVAEYYECEIRMRHKNGHWVWVLVRGKIVASDEHGKPLRMAGTHTDISARKEEEEKRKQLEKELLQSQRLESIGLLAGGVAHDLNNILSGIIGYPELLLLDLPEDSRFREPIEALHASGQRAAAVVADLLTVARGAACTRTTEDLNALILEHLRSPETKKLESLYPNITFQHQLEAEQPAVLCSEVHIKKSLMNLITNAAEAVGSRADGTVLISTLNCSVAGETHEGDEMNSRYRGQLEQGEYVVLTVQDNGPGIQDADLEHIFDPFYTKKVMGRSGTGLGLTVVWNAITDHHGKIFVQSSHEGTCFQVCFPVSEEIATDPIMQEKKEQVIGHNEHILVVDDEPQLLDIASGMLQYMGYRVHTVCSGELAVQFISKTPVDLVVLDMLMAPGMNGRETYEEILTLYPEQKAVIASGFSESDDVRATLRRGAAGFIRKPYSMEELGRAVKNALVGTATG